MVARRPETPLTVTPTLGSDLLSEIGNTPILRVRIFEQEFPDVTVLAKAEFLNPGGSVKDRAALRMIEEGERSGAHTLDKTILDSTSGNTGVAYAMIGAAKGYAVRLVMPSNVSQERKQLIEAYGAEIVFSDPLEGSDGAILQARSLRDAQPDRYFMPDQYNNPANWQAHYDTTAAEIWEQTDGRITHFVAGLGTSGTFIGTTRRLREFDPAIKALSVQPESSWHGLEGMKHMPTALVPGIYDPTVADDNLWAPTEASYDLARTLARSEGIVVGHSSGANLWGAREIAKGLGHGVIVTVFCDGGDRYLSTGLYGALR